jgi:pimeloyl-ACP methyl ester carboxylesterase
MESRVGIERFVDISGRRVRVRVRGEGTPLLLINGLGSNVAMWTPLLEQLDGLQVVTFDAPGVGLSQTPLMPYRIAWIADVARRLLDELGLERADVLGFSLGGAVAQQLAYREPERVRRLVLVSTSCGVGAVPGSLRALLAVMTPVRQYNSVAYRVCMEMIQLAPAEKDSASIREQMGSWHQQATPPVLGYMLQMAAYSAFHSLPWLHHIKQPALVLSGADDHLIPMANSAVLAAYLPNARLHIFERWGHYLLHDAASGAGSLIAGFVGADSHETSSAWQIARAVSVEDMARSVRAAPRSAHPAQFSNALARCLYPPRNGRNRHGLG